jgi:cell division protein FtsQ
MRKRSVLTNQSIRKRKKSGGLFVVFGVITRIVLGFTKIFCLILAVAVISLSFISIYHYLLNSPYVKLRQVKVTGVDGKIRHDLIRIAGLNSELSLVSLNLEKLKQKMEEHPWVRSVKLERRFPHSLIISVEKQIPSALVMTDKIHYMNQHGEIFKEVNDSEEMDFPIITGASQDILENHEQLQRAARVIKILESEKGLWSLNELSEIHLERNRGMSIYFSHLAAEIKVTVEDLEDKMYGLSKVAEHLSKTGRIHQVDRIDLNHVDGAVVSFRKG